MSAELTTVTIRIGISAAAADAALVRLSEAMRAAMPSFEAMARAMKGMIESWPGMPYTAPSLWDADQMAAAR